MIWLIAEIWVFLVSAFLIGSAFGWWLARLAPRPRRKAPARGKGGGASVLEPSLIPAPLGRPADDLTQIIGLDAATAERLHGLGVHYIDQVAAWSEANERWIEHKIGQPGRVSRERWPEQARGLSGTSE